MIVEVDGVLVSTEILTEPFCCDLDECGGQCCVEGDAGPPITLDEIAYMEESMEAAWPYMSEEGRKVVDSQGVAYTDREGALVASIVGERDCAFAFHEGKCCFCSFERAAEMGLCTFRKPISCALYPIREVDLGEGLVGLNFDKWKVCKGAKVKGKLLGISAYRFLEAPLCRRFGKEWYSKLCETADEMRRQGYI